MQYVFELVKLKQGEKKEKPPPLRPQCTAPNRVQSERCIEQKTMKK